MENHEKTFNTICRVCLNHGKAEKMVSLIDESNENGLSYYGISFEKLTQISVKQNDYVPTKLCSKCKRSLERVATFIVTSDKTDKKLAKLINFSLKQDLCGEMVEEVIQQYTLFNQNCPDDSEVSFELTNQYDALLSYSDKQHFKTEDHPKIKVELDFANSDSEDEISIENLNKKSVSESDNVDSFLYSIEKLITTKIEDIETQTCQDPTPKTYSIEKLKSSKNEDNKTQTSHEPRPKKNLHKQNFTCNICHRVLANKLTYKHHMERHEGCRYVCDQCGKNFPVLAELTQHQIYRHGIGSVLECDQCPFKAARRLHLIEHMRLHTGERPFTCEKCGLTFRRKAIYKNHLKSHGEKTVQCEYCPRMFYRRSAMLAHMNNIHDRVYVFLCKVCNVTYAMAKTVRRHMLVKHGIPKHKQGKVVRINKPTDNTNNSFFQESKKSQEFTA